jgi:molybdate transport system substrate-binding protein
MTMIRMSGLRGAILSVLVLVVVPILFDASPARAAGAAAPAEIIVYAAASLKDALNELGPICGRASGATLVYNFGASNDLARQIMAANKADVFFSADEGWMDQVAAKDLVDTGSRRSLLSNRLVVIVPADSSLTIGSAADLAGAKVKHLSLANPDAVPAGKYARAWLEKTGAWEKAKDKVVPAPDVRAALAAVEAGAAEAGVVYKTDAGIAKRAKVVFTVPESEGPKISYPAAALKDRPNLDAARRVVDCYAGSESRKVFERFGFVVLDAAAAPAAAPK